MKAKMKVVMKPQQDGFKRPMFDVKLDLDEISLNLNRDQVIHSALETIKTLNAS